MLQEPRVFVYFKRRRSAGKLYLRPIIGACLRPELHKQAVHRALLEGKSLNQYVEEAIEQYSARTRS
ncbi:MAG TPA: toxin-antitoxin system HicB family antitoxin [Syntrophomonas sp.]|nr:toxin-antitoxin system HicB family antitoxin [Syntrophomonas sp.]